MVDGGPLPKLGYVPALDGLRGVAVLLVIGFHAFNWPRNGGTLGVGIFFVLSGFLITKLLLEEFAQQSSIDLPAFYARRALRLFPLLYVALLLVASSLPFFVDATDRSNYTSSLAYCALYIGDLYGYVGRFHELAGALQHLWTLAVEEQFYLIWPVTLLVLIRRIRPSALLSVVVTAMAAFVGLRVLLLGAGKTIWSLPTTHADALLTGCAIAIVIHQRGPGHISSRWLAQYEAIAGTALVLVVALPYVVPKTALGAGYIVIEVIGALLVLCALADGRLARILGLRTLVYCGRISYGLYVLHTIVYFALVRTLASERHWVLATCSVAITFALAAASRHWFESYFLRISHRRFRPQLSVEFSTFKG